MTEKTMELEKQETESPARPERRRTFTPRVDIHEMDDKVVVLADMPGVSESELDITLENNILTITGRVEPPSFEAYRPAHTEYRTGDYVRSFTLSDTIDRDNIEAIVKNGVLTVLLPKYEEAQETTKRIAVKAG